MDMGMPMDRRGCLVFLTLGVLIVLAAFFIHRTYSYAICSGTEREAIATVSLYETRPMSPKPNLEVGSCQINYDVQSDREDVASYYRTALKDRGWVRPDSDSMMIEGQGKVEFDYGEFHPYGMKDNILYEVSVESYSPGETSIYIHVSSLGA